MFLGMTVAAATPRDLGGALRILSDPTRLRILDLLEREELAVGELSRALDLAQSRVSNHLRLLREAGLLRERRVATRIFLRLAPAAETGPLAARVWSVLREELDDLAEHRADRVRLAQVLAARRDEPGFFDRVAGEWDKIAGSFTTGRARERAALHLLPRPFVVADLGSGTGTMAEALLECATTVICIDISEAMLAQAEKRLAPRARSTTLAFRPGTLDALPLADAEVDGVVAGMVLHHLENLDGAFAEMFRVLAPGGAAAVLELAPHHEEWMRAELGDRHLGLPQNEVLAAFERAGFQDLVLDPVEDQYRPRRSVPDPSGEPVSLSLYVVRGRKPRG